jgi:hypothetical protein
VEFAFIIPIAFVLMWLESLLGRWKLRRDLAAQGWELVRARWRPIVFSRTARFRIEAERDDRRELGRAYVGGQWTGPVWSSQVDYEWDRDELPTGR